MGRWSSCLAILLIACVSCRIAENECACVFDETLTDGRCPVVAASVVASTTAATLVGERAKLLLRKVVLAPAVLDAVHSQWRL